jgi:inhibitor of cysteine peptidase
MRMHLGCLTAIAMMVTVNAQASAADQTLRLTVGQSASIELQENPSTGYRWGLDATAGSNLSILRISDRGFSERNGGRRLVGAPGIHRWDIEAVAAGTARVVFVYRRPWEDKAARRHEVAVTAR